MCQSFGPFSEPEASVHARSLADFTTTTSGFRFSVHTGRFTLCHQYFNLAKQRHDLLRTEPLLRHGQSSFPSTFSHIAWSKKARSGQARLHLFSPNVRLGRRWIT